MQLTDFQSNIPDLYKPLFFICIGVWGWTIVITILKWQHIDINTLTHTTSSKSNRILPLVLYAFYMTMVLMIHIMILEDSRFFKQYDSHFGPVILCYLCIASLTLLGPCHQDCRKFLLCLHRLFFHWRSLQIYLSDIIVADVLISFSVVFTGVFTHLIQDAHISHSILIPVISSIPYLIRLRQCLYGYFNSDFNKKQLTNAFKYLSTLPVIFLAHHTNINHAAINSVVYEHFLWKVWIILNLFSNAFAFIWDITVDWGLLDYEQETIIFRKDLYFSDPSWYLLGTVLNGCFRILKIGSQFYHVHPCCVDLAEIVRRWIWVIFRFEYEHVKHQYIDAEKRIGFQQRID